MPGRIMFSSVPWLTNEIYFVSLEFISSELLFAGIYLPPVAEHVIVLKSMTQSKRQ